MGAKPSKSFAKLKILMKSCFTTTGNMLQSISDSDARTKLTSELAHPTPNDIFYTPPLIDPHRNRPNADQTPRYVPYDSALLTHGCSGRNVTWQYLHAGNGSLPYPYSKCLGVERLLIDHGCNMGMCMVRPDDKEAKRYRFYDWDGLGEPLVKKVAGDQGGDEAGKKVYVDEDLVQLDGGQDEAEVAETVDENEKQVEYNTEEDDNKYDEDGDLKPTKTHYLSKRRQIPNLSLSQVQGPHRYGSPGPRSRKYRQRIPSEDYSLSTPSHSHSLPNTKHPTPLELNKALTDSSLIEDMRNILLGTEGQTQEINKDGIYPSSSLDLAPKQETEHEHGHENGNVRHHYSGYKSKYRPSYEITSPPTFLNSKPFAEHYQHANTTDTYQNITSSPSSARQNSLTTSSDTSQTQTQSLTPSQASGISAGILAFILLLILCTLYHRASARKRRSWWNRLNTNMLCRTNIGTRVEVTGGGFDDDAQGLVLSDFDFGDGDGNRNGVNLGLGRGGGYRDVVDEEEVGGEGREMV